MTNIILQKLDKDGNAQYTYNFNTFKTFDYDLNFPVSAMPLPQEDTTEQILIKVEGNSSVLKFSWILKNETATIVTGTGNPVIKTIGQQMDFWRNIMRPIDIETKYALTIPYNDGVTVSSLFLGTISNVHFSMTDGTPVTMVGNFEFLEGRVISGGYESDNPSPPQNITISSPGAGQFTVNWTASKNPGSSAVLSWIVQYALIGSTFTNVGVAVGTFTKNVSGLPAGTYIVRVVAVATWGNGDPSVQVEQVVA